MKECGLSLQKNEESQASNVPIADIWKKRTAAALWYHSFVVLIRPKYIYDAGKRGSYRSLSAISSASRRAHSLPCLARDFYDFIGSPWMENSMRQKRNKEKDKDEYE